MNNIIKKVYDKIKKFKVADTGQVRPNFKGKKPKGMTFIGFYRIPLDMLITKTDGHVLSNIRAIVSEHKNSLVSLIESGLWQEGSYIPPTVIITKSGKLVLLTGEHTYQAFYDVKSGDLFVAIVEFDTFKNAKTWQSNENANIEYVKRGRDDDQVAQSSKDILQKDIEDGLVDNTDINKMEQAIIDILKDQDITKSLVGESKVRKLITKVLEYFNDNIEVVKNYTDIEFKEYFEKTFKNKTLSNGKFVLNNDNSIIINNDITENEKGLNILRYQQKLLKLANYLYKMNYPLDKIRLEIINHFSTPNSKTYAELLKEDKSNIRLKKYFASLENILKFKDFFLKADKHNVPQMSDKK